MEARNKNFFLFVLPGNHSATRLHGFIANLIWLLCIGYLIYVCVKTYIIKFYERAREKETICMKLG